MLAQGPQKRRPGARPPDPDIVGDQRISDDSIQGAARSCWKRGHMTTKKRTPTLENGAAPAPAPKKAAAKKPSVKELVLPSTLTVKQLGDLMKVSPVEVIKQLM